MLLRTAMSSETTIGVATRLVAMAKESATECGYWLLVCEYFEVYHLEIDAILLYKLNI